ncbi:MAG: hypothetical protein JWO53_521 [Chlamydiia bacterium]|nr:hypothetical protein [Chlamydiia bacterium]
MTSLLDVYLNAQGASASEALIAKDGQPAGAVPTAPVSGPVVNKSLEFGTSVVVQEGLDKRRNKIITAVVSVPFSQLQKTGVLSAKLTVIDTYNKKTHKWKQKIVCNNLNKGEAVYPVLEAAVNDAIKAYKDTEKKKKPKSLLDVYVESIK